MAGRHPSPVKTSLKLDAARAQVGSVKSIILVRNRAACWSRAEHLLAHCERNQIPKELNLFPNIAERLSLTLKAALQSTVVLPL